MSTADTPFVLIDDRLSGNGQAWLYQAPCDVIACHRMEDVPEALARLDAGLAAGLYAAGFCSYELGYGFEAKLRPLVPPDRQDPLLWFGVFKTRETLGDREVAQFLRQRMVSGHRIEDLRFSLMRDAYGVRIKIIKDLIEAGDVYQVNFTFPLSFRLWGDPLSLYATLRARQQVRYGAFLHTGEADILSLSPELFYETDTQVIRTRPMKGTVKRSPDPHEDARLARWLAQDPKNRAENLMILDLLRNDVGRIAEIGSVRVPDLFKVESYPTLHTMTSSVEARVRDGLGPSDILSHLFPCGSITGAPKIRAMEVIRDLETSPRAAYTGAIGHMGPDGFARFNVGIRTITVQGTGQATMGIGSGIVADSDATSEYDECLLKARFLMEDAEPFGLIETMGWTRETGIPRLDGHMKRLARSAQWFGFTLDEKKVRNAIDQAVSGTETPAARIRLVLQADGSAPVTVTPIPLADPAREMVCVLSDKRIDAADPHFAHKTTRRALYDTEHARLTAETGCDEVLFLNRWDEVAEGSRTTIYIARNGVLQTPPLSSGALPGVVRDRMIAEGQAREAVLTLSDLQTADAIYLSNGVRGLVKARLLAPDAAISAASGPRSA